MPPAKRPTINDVAERAGVSKSTVSLVLKGSKSIKSEKRLAVLGAIRELNYVKNRAAATLRGLSTGLIGLIINDLRNPFFTEFSVSAQMEFSRQNYATVIANCNEDAKIQEQTIKSMLEHDVAAFLISPCYGEVNNAIEAILRSGLPVLQVLRRVNTPKFSLPFFTPDYTEGSRLAVKHLLDQDITKIAFVGGVEGTEISQDRMKGYLAEMALRNLPIKVFHGKSTRCFGIDMADLIIDKHSDIEATICFNDLVAIGMLTRFAARNINVGKDFFVVGFDDIEEAQLSFPPLTTVRCNISRFGRQSAIKLLNMMDQGNEGQPIEASAVELLVRGSSCRPAKG
ncbi:MAG: LacI family DNA-binding transcriptional regulator [Rhodobacteraceae bacterium]|nr:LacI family DNA-binding transcriptional regulator [Paracoccaceae bacterium]MCY4250993.1 LacI family DNA-binding transcriptional regulator [Paracoccaceae bacterium]MCY4307307.1 LacI family DNA-binding transcriptional regulator [Paracoccaceae bacterium]